jgi:hypothetical protein
VRTDAALLALLESSVIASPAKGDARTTANSFETPRDGLMNRDVIQALDDAFASVESEWRRL